MCSLHWWSVKRCLLNLVVGIAVPYIGGQWERDTIVDQREKYPLYTVKKKINITGK